MKKYVFSYTNLQIQIITYLLIGSLLGITIPLILENLSYKYLFFILFVLLVFCAILFGCIYCFKVYGFLDFMSPYILIPLMYLVIYGPGVHKALTLDQQVGEKILFFVSIAFVAYLVGAMSVNGAYLKMQKRKTIYNNNIVTDELIYKRIVRYTFIVGVVAMLAFWAKAGSIPALMSDLENSRVGALSGNGVFYYLSMCIMVSIWVLFLRNDDFKKVIIPLIFGCLMLLSTGWRNTSIALIFVAITIYHYKKHIKLRTLILAGICLVILIAVSGLFRIYSSDLQSYKLMNMMNSGDYIGAFFSYLYNYPVVFTNNLTLVLNYFPEFSNLLHGKSLFWNFGILLPGSTYQAFDFYLKDLLHVGFAGGGLPPTIIGDLYLNFGLLGVFLGMMLFGALWSYMYFKFITNKNNLIGLTSVIVLYYLSVSIRGGIENITLTTTWLLILILIFRSVSKYKFSRD